MRHENNLITDAKKIPANEPLFNARAAQTAQPVVPLASITTRDDLSEETLYAPRVAVRPARKKSNNLSGFVLVLAIAALATAVGFNYFARQNQSPVSEISAQAVDDKTNNSAKPKTLTALKPVEQSTQKVQSVAQNEAKKPSQSDPNVEQDAPRLTPDETEPGMWVSENPAAAGENESEPKNKERRRDNADRKIEEFVREVENAERQARRLKKIVDEFGND